MEWLRPKDYRVPCLRCFGQLRKAVLFPGGEPWGGGWGSGGGGLKLPPAYSRVTLETEGEAGVPLRASYPVVSSAFSTWCFSQSMSPAR